MPLNRDTSVSVACRSADLTSIDAAHHSGDAWASRPHAPLTAGALDLFHRRDDVVHVGPVPQQEVLEQPDRFFGADALRYLEGASVDLVLSDYAMPGMDGAELLRTLCGKPDTAHVPVVLVSAFPEEAVRRNCASMRAFLRKPFRASELLDTVREILG